MNMYKCDNYGSKHLQHATSSHDGDLEEARPYRGNQQGVRIYTDCTEIKHRFMSTVKHNCVMIPSGAPGGIYPDPTHVRPLKAGRGRDPRHPVVQRGA